MSPSAPARDRALQDPHARSQPRLNPAKLLSRKARAVLRLAQVIAGAAIALLVAHTAFGLGEPELNAFFDNWLYNGLVVGAALFCLARAALVQFERWAWLGLGIALALWSGGEIYYSAV